MLRNLLCLVAVCMGAAAQTQQGCPADWAQSITAQILDLRAHIGQLLADAHEQKVAELTREMEAIRGRQQALDKEEQLLRQQINDVEAQLTSSGLEPQARGQVEAIRTQLAGEATEKLRSDRAALEQRQAEMAGRLAQELQTYQKVKDWVRQLESALSRQ
jgi:paraquat-inducible protein B